MSPPETIAHYRITTKLGEGGMGAVYRATDTKLNRDVAVKILPDSFAQDPDRLVRFAREAHLLASLNHPNIAAIYGVEERALVMELVEGPTLAERIARGAIPAEEAVAIGIQIAEALEYAHEKGIIHRDLKPANIKLTPEGRVKVLDFGLAKALSSDSAAGDPASSPTLTMRATQVGTIMGTAAYMSPEQAKGKPVDRRADIWAFGVVLYEMLTGGSLYQGETVSDTLAAVLTRDPNLNAVPAAFRPLLRRCLERDPRMRLRDIGEARIALLAPAPPETRARMPAVPTAALAGALVLALAAIVVMLLRAPAAIDPPVRRFTLTPRLLSGTPFTSTAVISPNGKRIAYVAESKLWVREMDREEARSFDGTEGAYGPFWSPESESVAFAAREQLWKVSLRGGAPVSLCFLASSTFFGGAWSSDGKTIVLSVINSGLLAVPAQGGEPQVILKPSVETGPFFHSPQPIPEDLGAGWMLMGGGDLSLQKIIAVNPRTGERREIGPGAFPVYSPTGHIIFSRTGTAGSTGLWAVPVSRELKLSGPAFPLAPGGTHASVAQDGTLVYTDGERNLQMVFRDRSGARLGVAGIPQPGVGSIAVSPDGKKAALNSSDQGSLDIWVQDLTRNLKSRVTFDPGAEIYPKWSADGRQIAFRRNNDILVQASDGTGEAAVLVKDAQVKSPGDWSTDGKYIIYTVTGSVNTGTSDIWYLKRKPDGGGFEPAPYIETRFEESSPRLSPNGRFAAYLSNESGRFELYVRPFPEGAGKWQVSTNSAMQPRWSRDGKQLFYLEGENLMAVAVTTDGAFTSGGATRLFATGSHLLDRNSLKYDVMPDGRFLLLEPAEGEGEKFGAIHVVENWLAAFRGGPERKE